MNYELSTVQLGDFLATLKTLKRNTRFAGVKEDVSSWNGGLTYDAAVDLLENGWNDAPAIQAITLPNLEQLAVKVKYTNDVEGEILDIGAYSTGSPDCFLRRSKTRKQGNKILKLAVEIGGLQNVSATELANRGQAIIALIQSMEWAGYSVELTIVRAYRATSYGTRINRCFLIPVKKAGEMLDVRRLQFVIGHPAFFRRCLFAYSEHLNGGSMYDITTHTESYKPEGFIHIPHYAGRCRTIEESMQWAEQFAHDLTTAPAIV